VLIGNEQHHQLNFTLFLPSYSSKHQILNLISTNQKLEAPNQPQLEDRTCEQLVRKYPRKSYTEITKFSQPHLSFALHYSPVGIPQSLKQHRQFHIKQKSENEIGNVM